MQLFLIYYLYEIRKAQLTSVAPDFLFKGKVQNVPLCKVRIGAGRLQILYFKIICPKRIIYAYSCFCRLLSLSHCIEANSWQNCEASSL